MDLFGEALKDYQKGRYTEDLITFTSLEQEDILPLPHLFRSYENMPFLEQQALKLCRGKVLDVGCGAGSHSLYLQERGFSVTALDVSEGAVQVCRLRGVKNVVHGSIQEYSGTKFDTILLLMNGIGVAEKIQSLGSFLEHLKTLLQPGGQILTDSTDILYVFEEEDGSFRIPAMEDYYGELIFTVEYKGQKSKPFPWFYIDFTLLKDIAENQGFKCELICSGDHFDYLACLTINTY
ncbi:class I SAM-dependent methyltransferase [Lentiprolixibacter aurantiacus]|uniref:Class I SAM-dependent methyltransferase n=1 Tax=Lentiprolixibacter aurantiacus TaxID=2993939 RepID=A0AAE3SPF4_9FLAO|nr:class I SAM-dependent methyltransferase [Lentiprolixibacter aurantiacus]MCX2720629.1 class I SAM-dependent methyltransferase [Lentiprolixibacter aurantiacus]